MAGQEWTTEELIILEENYHKGESAESLIKLLPNRTVSSIWTKASLMGLKSTYMSGRKYEYDKSFWNEFSPQNCYWGGFAAADGCIMRAKNRNNFRIMIKEKYHLEKFNICNKSNYPIHYNAKDDLYNIDYSVSDEWAYSLKAKFNIVPRKTYILEFPSQIPEDLIPYWLIGFIDGDGCFHLSKNNYFTLSFIGASPYIMDSINAWISKYYKTYRYKPRNVRVSNHKGQNHYRLSIGGAAACNLYLDLRTYLPEMHLARKWDRPDYIEYCENYSKKFPVSQNKFSQI